MTFSPQAIVIGAGISGLACALRLAEMGVSVQVLEAAKKSGGMVATIERDGFLFEAGPQSLQMTPELGELIRAVKYESEVIEANPHTPRYVLYRGKLRPAPMSPPALLATSLLGIGSKSRVLREALRRTKPPGGDESFADFVRRKFGTEILEHLAGPFVSGIFAGDPEKLSLRSTFPTMVQWEEEYGSIVRGAMKSRGPSRTRPTLAGFQRGMGSFMDSLARKLASRLKNEVLVEPLERASGAAWTVPCREAQQRGEWQADAVVIATPAYEAARLVQGFAGKLAAVLQGIPYAPVAVVAEGYPRGAVHHALNGFGFLVPRTEGLRTLGTVWNSSLFPGRAPQGMVLMTSFAGGALDSQMVEMTEEQIGQCVGREIGKVLGITGPPAIRQVWRHTRALPQYNLGHAQKVAAIRSGLQEHRGLFFAGNYLDGPSVGNCVSQAFRTARAVRDYLPG